MSHWTTAAQRELLDTLVPEYLEIHASSNPKYGDFWAKMRETWFSSFPEIDVKFPEATSINDLSADERKVLTQAIETRIKVCRMYD